MVLCRFVSHLKSNPCVIAVVTNSSVVVTTESANLYKTVTNYGGAGCAALPEQLCQPRQVPLSFDDMVADDGAVCWCRDAHLYKWVCEGTCFYKGSPGVTEVGATYISASQATYSAAQEIARYTYTQKPRKSSVFAFRNFVLFILVDAGINFLPRNRRRHSVDFLRPVVLQK